MPRSSTPSPCGITGSSIGSARTAFWYFASCTSGWTLPCTCDPPSLRQCQPRVDVDLPAGLVAAADGLEGGGGDHRRVVGAEGEGRVADRHVGAALGRDLGGQPPAQGGVGGDAAGEEDGPG